MSVGGALCTFQYWLKLQFLPKQNFEAHGAQVMISQAPITGQHEVRGITMLMMVVLVSRMLYSRLGN